MKPPALQDVPTVVLELIKIIKCLEKRIAILELKVIKLGSSGN